MRSDPQAGTLLRLLRAVADESRLRILNLVLDAREICVCDIERTLNFTQTKVSRHLAVLKNAGLVSDRRIGLWILYSFTGDGPEEHKPLIRGLRDIFASHPLFREDIRRLRQAVKNGRCTTFNVIFPRRGARGRLPASGHQRTPPPDGLLH